MCLKAAGKRTPVPGHRADRRRAPGPVQVLALPPAARDLRGAAVVNGKTRTVPPVANGIGYEITPRKVRRLPGVAVAALPDRVSARAGIVVTGTEVLTGRVTDRNGPWLSERLRELGVDHAYTLVVGDRREDMEEALRFLAARGVDVIVTSGGLGPTADDLTAEVVGAFAGPRDGARRGARGAHRRDPAPAAVALARPRPRGDPRLQPQAGGRARSAPPSSSRSAPRRGSSCRSTAGPTVVVLPGPPRELHAMWPAAVADRRPSARPSPGRSSCARRCCGCSGSPSRRSPRRCALAEDAHGLEGLEITTCLRRGEVEVVTRFAPAAAASYERFVETVRERHADTLFSDDGRTVDQQVADLLRARGLTIATAESCTGGLLAGAADRARRLVGLRAGRARRLLQRGEGGAGGRRSRRSSSAWARCRSRWPRRWPTARGRALGADVGVGITGVAGPGGGTPEKPVGLVCFSVAGPDGARLTRSVNLPGGRADVRDRSTTVAMHLVRGALLAGDGPALSPVSARLFAALELPADVRARRWRPSGARRPRATARCARRARTPCT